MDFDLINYINGWAPNNQDAATELASYLKSKYKAINYTLKRWTGLNAYLYDGILEIDNNLAVNAIRPLALGRKNYLFAGSHKAAQRAASIYSLFAICKKHQVNPYNWLKYVLENILDTKASELDKFYPQNFQE